MRLSLVVVFSCLLLLPGVDGSNGGIGDRKITRDAPQSISTTNIGYTQNLQWTPHEAVGELVIAGDSW